MTAILPAFMLILTLTPAAPAGTSDYAVTPNTPQERPGFISRSDSAPKFEVLVAQNQFGRVLTLGREPTGTGGNDLAWFEKQAEAGWPDAQYRLGYMYYFGIGMPQDYTLAYKWFYLAARAGSTDAASNRDIAEKRMTAEQLAAGQQLAEDWLAAHPQQ